MTQLISNEMKHMASLNLVSLINIQKKRECTSNAINAMIVAVDMYTYPFVYLYIKTIFTASKQRNKIRIPLSACAYQDTWSHSHAYPGLS